MTTYQDAGVNIELGDDASKMLYEAAKATWKNREGKLGELFTPNDTFSGVRVWRVGGLPYHTVTSMGFDGIGTKVVIAQRLGRHDTVAFDLFGMVTDDAVVHGAEPTHIGSILDVKSLEPNGLPAVDQVRELAKGYVAAADAAGVAIVNGEIAEIGACVGGYGDFNYNWGAGVVWYADERKLITRLDIRPGDMIVSLREHGFRSNGLSLVRRIMEKQYGPEWHATPDGSALADAILKPTIIYTKAVVDMFGGALGEPKVKLTGVAHITGGGIPGKLGRTLAPSGLGAELYDLHEPPAAMQLLRDIGRVPIEDAYRTWNMGNGMLLITREPSAAIEIAQRHGIEARVAGIVRSRPGIIVSTYDGLGLSF